MEGLRGGGGRLVSTNGGGIRLSGERDIPRLIELTAAEGWRLGERDFSRLMALWPKGLYVYEEGKRVVGMVTVSTYGRTAWIGNLVVERGSRGRGIGSALMERALSDLDSLGIRSTLLYSVKGVEGFYGRFGFSIVDSYVVYSGIVRATRRRPRASPMSVRDLPGVVGVDVYAFGDDRSALLERILGEFPQTSLVHRSLGSVVGYVMATESNNTFTIGPAAYLAPGADEVLIESIATLLDGRRCFLTAPSVQRGDVMASVGLERVAEVTMMVRGPPPPSHPECLLAAASLGKG